MQNGSLQKFTASSLGLCLFLALIKFKISVFCCIYNINLLDFPHLIGRVSSACLKFPPHVFLFAFNINGFHLCLVIGPAHTCLITANLSVYLKAVLMSYRFPHVWGFSPAAPVFNFRTIMVLWRACVPTCVPSVVLSRFCLLEQAEVIFGHAITSQ